MRGRAEAIKPQAPRAFGHAPRSISDQSCTQQRRCMYIVNVGREFETIPRVGDDMLSVSTIELIPSERGVVAEIFLATQTELARTIRVAQPRHAESRAELIVGACAAAHDR